MLSDVFLVEELARYVLAFARSRNISADTFLGVAEGATKLGIITQYLAAHEAYDYGPGSHVLAMERGKIKEHGAPQDRYFLGLPRGKIVLLEDVTTTGDSLLSTAAHLYQTGREVQAALSLTDRKEFSSEGESVKETLERKGIEYHFLTDAPSLLPLAFEVWNYPQKREIGLLVEKEFREYGLEKIKLVRD